MNISIAESAYRVINSIAIDLYKVYYYVSVVCLFVWFILSTIWLFILISEYFSERKYFKFQWKSGNSMRDEMRVSCLRNHVSKQTKNKLLILLCAIEIVAALIIIMMCYGNVSASYIDRDITVRFIQPVTYTDSLTSRLLLSSVDSVVISLYDIVSMVNVCLIERYTYYPSECKHPVRRGFSRLASKLGIVMLLSCIVQLVPIKGVFILSTLSYEYIRLVKLTRKLISLLCKRRFDASNHEYQSAAVVAIYNKVYREYRIGSALLLTALFFQLFAMSLAWVYVTILTILCNPGWLRQVYNIPIHTEYIVAWDSWGLRSADRVVNTIIGVSIAIGFFLLAVPYLVVTCSYLYRNIVRWRGGNKGRGKHSFPSHLINKMIEEHNIAYWETRGGDY